MSAEAGPAPGWLDASLSRARGAWAAAADVHPAYVVGGLVTVQWIAVIALALTVRHNGWLYYAGGDQLWHYTGAYLLAHGHLPPSYVGYGWAILLAPLALAMGPNLVAALSGIVLFNTVVLLPIALLCMYGIASRIGGRVFGYWTAALWIAIPYLGILVLEPGYHQKYTELTLPQLVGLSSAPDFPATVALLVCAYFCLRAADSGGAATAAAAGLAAGYAIAIKPSNSIFLVAPALLFLASRWRALPWFAAALAPALLTLAVWKYRGLGEFAATPAAPVRLAGAGGVFDRIYTPELNSWQHLHEVLLALREHFWVARVIEALPLAGMLALLVRSRRALLLVGSWFVVYVLVKATYIPASVDDASFWRIMMPAFPAFVLLAAAIVLVVPGIRAAPAQTGFTLRGRWLTGALAAAFVVFAAVPLAALATVPRLHDQGRLAVRASGTLVPVANMNVVAAVDGAQHAVRLRWRGDKPRIAAGFYYVLRTPGANAGIGCGGRINNSSDNCVLYADAIRATRATTFVDRPGRGTWTYRIGVAANWLDDPTLGDVYVVSNAATAVVP
jgi:hypothetical protein